MPSDISTRIGAWVAAYERAWRTAGTEALADLFDAHATYRTAPFENPYRGLEAISAFWERERGGHAESFAATFETVAAENDTGVVRAEVRYEGPPERVYRDLWIVTLHSRGSCTHFEEWPFWSDDSEGTFARGPER